VNVFGQEKTVALKNVSIDGKGYDNMLLSSKDKIVDILTGTDEWKSLPEYD